MMIYVKASRLACPLVTFTKTNERHIFT